MRAALGGLMALSSCFALETVKSVRSGRPFAAESVFPVMNRGYLFFIERTSPKLDVYRPDGGPLFTATLTGPNGAVPRLNDAAIGEHGQVAVASVYEDSSKNYRGAILLLDPAGVQTASISTGNYAPSHLCFGSDGSLWTRGWQRDPNNNDREDPQDYSIIHRYDAQGNEIGRFVNRSSFPAGLSPGGAFGGRWRIRAAGDRIGALMYTGRLGDHLVWLELEQSGQEAGRWTLPTGISQGYACTPEGLFAVNTGWDQERRIQSWELDRLDKNSSNWKPLSKPECPEDGHCFGGVLMDADGRELVLTRDSGVTLEWVRP